LPVAEHETVENRIGRVVGILPTSEVFLVGANWVRAGTGSVVERDVA